MNHRALMVSSVLAKAQHRILRSDLMATFKGSALPLQVGGLPGRAVGQGAHCLWAFSSMCRQHKYSAATLFVDIRQAFYRMIRSHVIKVDALDESIARLFDTLKLPPEAFAEFANALEQNALQDLEVSPFLQAHLAESMLYTWFQLPGDDRISQTRKGSRPGDNLADLLFSFAFRKILQSVMEELDGLGIDLSFESISDRNPFPYQCHENTTIVFNTLGPIWADDLAVLIWDQSADKITNKSKVVAQVLIDALALRGMEVNLEKGKTEIIFDLRGHNSHKIKAEIFRHGDPKLFVKTRFMGDVHVGIATNYKHLGTVYTSGGKVSAEIRQRLGQARAEFRRYRKGIYSNGTLDIKHRISLFQTLVLTGLMFDVAIWPELCNQERKLFEEGVHGLYNSLSLAIWGEEVYSWRQDRMRARLGLPHPTVLASVARLRHLHHLCMQADDYIWGFLHLDMQWLQLVRKDIEWLRLQIPKRLPQTDPHHNWSPWMEDIRMGRRWKNNIKVAQLHSILQTTKRSDWSTWHRQFLELLREEGLWQSDATKQMQGGYACLRCQKCFRSAQAWSVHAFVVHGRCTPSRRYAEGTQCMICLKEYAFHSRLVNHLRTSKKCHLELQKRGLVAAVEPSIGSAHEAKLQRVRRCVPVLKVYGPMEPTNDEPDEHDHWNGAEDQFFESIIDAFEDTRRDGTSADILVSRIWKALQSTILCSTELLGYLRRAVEDYRMTLDLQSDDEGRMGLLIDEAIDIIERRWSWNWLCGHMNRSVANDLLGDGKTDMVQEVEKLNEKPLPCPRVDRPFASRQLVFLHLFSGQRRKGDLQEAIELFATTHDLQVRALSVDVVISLRCGDMLRRETQQVFMEALRLGWVCGLAAGPPCETWSRAREHQLATDNGPRPVRAISTPEGLGQLSIRELKQVLFGNQLLSIAVLMLTLCWLYGVCGILEHPAEPPKATSVSIWRLPILRYLARQPQIASVTVMQGYYGAQSPKPTKLMITHPSPQLEKIMREHRTRETLPLKSSIGKLDDGSYATSSLKTYPPGLCTALAAAWGHSILRRTMPTVDAVPPSYLEEIFSALHKGAELSEGAQDAYGHDFCADAQYQPV